MTHRLNLFAVITAFLIFSPFLCFGNNSSLDNSNHETVFKTNLTQIQNITIGILPSFNISSIGSVIQQLLNQTGLLPTSSTTPPPSTNTTTNGTTTPIPSCQCGKGGKPKVPKFQYNNEVFEESEELEDEGGGEVLNSDEDSEEEDNQTRIVHGTASNPGAWPWMASLIIPTTEPNPETEFGFCGGTLISSQFVMTAAHCFKDFPNKTTIIGYVSVLLGSNSIKTNVTDRTHVRIIDVRVHPKYNNVTSNNDIALLKLAVPISFTSNIQPICLSQNGKPFKNRKVIAAGWGTTNVEGETGQPYLREAGMRTITNSKCKSSIPGLTKNMICALSSSPASNSNVCRGDSGGPLMLWLPKTKTFTQIGLTSFGHSFTCGQKGFPSVFTRVNNYLSFVREVTNGTAFCTNSFTT